MRMSTTAIFVLPFSATHWWIVVDRDTMKLNCRYITYPVFRDILFVYHAHPNGDVETLARRCDQ